MTVLIILIIGFVSFPTIINTNLSLGRINGGEYVLNNNTTNGIVIYNKSCSECLCLTFLFNQTEGYQGLNCYPSSNTSINFSTTISSITTSTTTTSTTVTLEHASTGRYWACCKTSCAWPGKAAVTNPVQSCAHDGVTVVDPNAVSSCDGGGSFMCLNQQPWNVSDTLSYGYVGAYISGQDESRWCCACYSLKFTSGLIQGKEMIVQVVNTAYTSSSEFVLHIPGVGWTGTINACPNQWGSSYTWGDQYNGMPNRQDCDGLPGELQRGCYWRFDWFMNTAYPSVEYQAVTCPSILTDNTNCIRY